MEPILIDTPFGHVHVLKEGPGGNGKFLLLDIDHTMTDSSCQHALEDREDTRMAGEWGLDARIFHKVREGDVTTRPFHFSLAYTVPAVATWMGAAFPHDQATALRMNTQFLANVRWRETQVQSFAGVDETLEWARTKYGDDLTIGFITDCDTWLGYLRLREAQHDRLATHGPLIRHFKLFIGVQAMCPDELETGPYAECLHQSRQWIERIWTESPEYLEGTTILALPKKGAKPSPIGAQIALKHFNATPSTKVLLADDKASKGGKVIAGLAPDYPEAKFAYAAICPYAETLGADSPPVHFTLTDFRDLKTIMENMFE